MKENYHKILLNEISKIVKENKHPKLLLHSCCAPCSSYVIQFLSEYFDMEVFSSTQISILKRNIQKGWKNKSGL